jgi:hypothetical protein
MPLFRRLLSLALLAAGAAAGSDSTTTTTAPAPLFSQIDEMLRSLSSITGWPVHRKVPAKTIGNDEFRKMLKGHVDKADPNKIRAEETTLKMFGLVPDDFSLAKETVDLFSEQVAAFYDSNKKRLFVLDNVATDLDRRIALVHELAHALADQQHSLTKYLHGKTDSDDEATARQAVAEGQATWLTWAYVSGRNGGKAEVPAAMVDALAKSAAGTGEQFPVYDKAPMYFRESLVFPYTEGLRFTDAVFRSRGKQGFEEVFRRAPVSTQQILHPDVYLAHGEASSVEAPKLESKLAKDSRQYREVSHGDLGEFDLSALLRQYTSEKEGLDEARHLKAAAFRLYESKRDKHPVLIHVTEWDSAESAKIFFQMYQRVLKGKWKKIDAEPGLEGVFRGAGDSGKFEVRMEGTRVQAFEGLR